jgi:hypothetical protein
MFSALRRPDQVGQPLSNGHFATVHQHNKVLIDASDKDRPKSTYEINRRQHTNDKTNRLLATNSTKEEQIRYNRSPNPIHRSPSNRLFVMHETSQGVQSSATSSLVCSRLTLIVSSHELLTATLQLFLRDPLVMLRSKTFPSH